MLHISLVDNIQIILSVGIYILDIHNCDRYVIGPNSYMLQICDRYLSHNCDRYVMGTNSYMLQICDRYFRTYILQIFYRTVTYICHISVSICLKTDLVVVFKESSSLLQTIYLFTILSYYFKPAFRSGLHVENRLKRDG
jgi:hypothetical protein